jgi:hypothetical protein
MSVTSTTANYGGRIDTQQGNIKQFVSSSNLANWIYRKIKSIFFKLFLNFILKKRKIINYNLT